MEKSIRILIVEDDPRDVELIERHLKREGYLIYSETIDSPTSLRLALRNVSFDVILSDYHLPLFGVVTG